VLILAALEPLPEPARPEPPVVVIAPAPPAPAPVEIDDEARRPAPEEKLTDGGGEIVLAGMAMQPDLTRVAFSGAGTPVGGYSRVQFHRTGRELGIQTPLLWGGELSARYLRRYFAVGAMGFIAGNPGGADATPVPPNGPATSEASARSLMAYGGAIDISGALPLGDVTLRAGPLTGIRAYSVPLTGFEPTTCKGRRGQSYPCAETATTSVLPFLQPRVSVDYAPGRSAGSFVVGAFAGADVFGGASFSAGVYVGVRSRHESLLP
jgi:hypothetical protein